MLHQHRLRVIILFGECYPAYFDLPDEAAKLEPIESSNRVLFEDNCSTGIRQDPISDAQSVPRPPGTTLASLEQLFELSARSTVDATDAQMWRAGTPSDCPNLWSAWIPGVSPSHERRWNLAHIHPGHLYFIEVLSLEHPTDGGHQLIHYVFFGYDLKKL